MSNYVDPLVVCQFLAMDGSNANVLADVTFMLDYAEYLAEGYMGTSYVATAAHTIRYFNGLGTDMLSMCPVISSLEKVESLDDSGAVIATYYGNQTATLDDVVLQPNNPRNGGYRWLKRRRGAVFPLGLENIKVTGIFGTPTVPAGLPMALSLIVSHLFNMRMHNEFIRYEMNGERQVFQIDPKAVNQIPKTAMDILDGLRVYNLELSE